MDSLFLLPTQALSLPLVRGPEFSLQHCPGRQRPGMASLMPGRLPRPVPPWGLSACQAGLRPQSSGLTWIWSEPLSTGPSLSTENHLFGGW